MGGVEARMRLGSVLLATLVLQLATTARAENFPRPESLEPNVRFWRAVFADYSRHQVVVHDTLDLDKIYSVLDFRSQVGNLTEGEMDRWIRDASENEVTRIRGLLYRFGTQGAPADLSADDKRIYDLYAKESGSSKFVDAMDRVRSQRGLREKFAEGIRIAHG